MIIYFKRQFGKLQIKLIVKQILKFLYSKYTFFLFSALEEIKEHKIISYKNILPLD